MITGGKGAKGNLNPSNTADLGDPKIINLHRSIATTSDCDIALHICQRSGNTRIPPIFPSKIDTIITWDYGYDALKEHK